MIYSIIVQYIIYIYAKFWYVLITECLNVDSYAWIVYFETSWLYWEISETFGLKSSLVFHQTLVLNNLPRYIQGYSNNKMCWVLGTTISHLLHTRTKISMKTELFGVNHQIGQRARSIKQPYCWLFFYHTRQYVN